MELITNPDDFKALQGIHNVCEKSTTTLPAVTSKEQKARHAVHGLKELHRSGIMLMMHAPSHTGGQNQASICYASSSSAAMHFEIWKYHPSTGKVHVQVLQNDLVPCAMARGTL